MKIAEELLKETIKDIELLDEYYKLNMTDMQKTWLAYHTVIRKIQDIKNALT